MSLIAPGMTELSLVAQDLQRRGLPVLDINEIYASFATAEPGSSPTPAFKLGIVGGVGPAATVDFMGKVVAATPAGRDQDHIKMVVEQNPQIPDRTANLLREETDPTMAMYSTCKRLESAGAHAIAIPCNTAHAFVDRIQPHLRIPIVNMLMETARWISQRYGRNKVVGLLATSGTVQSRVYHDAAHQAGLTIITPGVEYQSMVMESIYGERGVKAGHTQGICRTQLLVAAEHLVELGAEVLILGCTELPLIEAHNEAFEVGGRTVALIDPTTILAQRCVALIGATSRPGRVGAVALGRERFTSTVLLVPAQSTALIQTDAQVVALWLHKWVQRLGLVALCEAFKHLNARSNHLIVEVVMRVVQRHGITVTICPKPKIGAWARLQHEGKIL